MPKRAAILDIDGTLVDSNYEHVRAWYRAFTEHGLSVPQAVIHRAIGMGGDNLVPHLLGIGPGDPRVESLQEAHGRIYRRDYLPRVRPLPGADALFSRLREAGYSACIASSANRSELEHYLRLLGAEGQVEAAISKDDVDSSKPAPDVFEAACARLEVLPAAALLLGDSVWDGEAARKLGLPFVGVLTGGFGAEELRGAGAVAVYRDLPDLLSGWDVSPFGRGSGR